MNESKKIIIVGVFILLTLSLIPLSNLSAKEKAKKIMIAYNSLFNEEETNIVVFGQTGCTACEQYVPVIDAVTEKYKIEYYYLDITKISKSQAEEALEKVGLELDTLGTPHTVIITKGEKTDEINGVVDRTTLTNKLIDNGIIVAEKKQPLLVDYETFKEAYKAKGKHILVKAASWCPHCINLQSTAETLRDYYDFDMYFLHQDTLTTEEAKDYKKFGKDIEALNCGYPLIMITENGKIIDSNCGGLDSTSLYNYLKEYEIIED